MVGLTRSRERSKVRRVKIRGTITAAEHPEASMLIIWLEWWAIVPLGDGRETARANHACTEPRECSPVLRCGASSGTVTERTDEVPVQHHCREAGV